MARYYYISCKEVGYPDCDFSMRGESIEDVVEHTADHARDMHGLKGFGSELYAQMRPHIRLVEDPPPATAR